MNQSFQINGCIENLSLIIQFSHLGTLVALELLLLLSTCAIPKKRCVSEPRTPVFKVRFSLPIGYKTLNSTLNGL